MPNEQNRSRPNVRMINDTDIRSVPDDAAANRDPLSGAPGAHPAGVAAGAAVGAATGTALGAIGGPVGAVIGAAAGGIAGGLVGKGVAEAVNPTAELEYWRNAYFHRPYAGRGSFADFEPAYRVTLDQYAQRPELIPFEHAEPRIRTAYEQVDEPHRDWSEVREASKDAWERVVKRTSQTATESQQSAAERANDVLQMLNDSIEGFNSAADRLDDPKFAHACRRYAAERENLAADLRPLIAGNGVQPATSTEIRGQLARAWLVVRSALGGGDRAIIENIEAAEDHAVSTYRDALASDDLDAETRAVLARQYPIVKAAHDQFSAWKQQLAEVA